MKSEVTVAFSSTKKIGSKFLEFFLFSKFSHTALIIDDMAYEARLIGGVQVKPEKDFAKENEGHLEYYTIKLTPEQKKRALDFSKKQVGKKYDFWGVFAFPFRKSSWQKDDKWFCSEYTAATLVHSGVINIKQKFNRINPRDLWILISNR